MIGIPWSGGEVRFCQSNKWGYRVFDVTGAEWNELRRRVESYVTAPTDAGHTALVAFMNGLAPPGLAEERI